MIRPPIEQQQFLARTKLAAASIRVESSGRDDRS